jgi:hypothetical protein
MSKLHSVIATAISTLSPRQQYAASVLRGHQAWSGADLKGKARKYGSSYSRQRGQAKDALYASGGQIIALQHAGKLVSAVVLCTDDFGNQILETNSGLVIPHTKTRCRLIS